MGDIVNNSGVAIGRIVHKTSMESGQLGPFQSRPPANSAHTNYKPSRVVVR